MLLPRLLPCLLMENGSLVKTIKFTRKTYIGDPANVVRIFNEKEVDELLLLDIAAMRSGRGIDFKTLENVASECFMPLCYGGGVSDLAQMRVLFSLGVEKISLSSAAIRDQGLVRRAADEFGSQAIVVTLDVKRTMWGTPTVRILNGRINTGLSVVECAKKMVALGVGEIIINSIDREGTWSGIDLPLMKAVSQDLGVPVVACGGAGSLKDISDAVKIGGASAVAIGSMAVFQGKDKGVLVKFPSREAQESIFV